MKYVLPLLILILFLAGCGEAGPPAPAPKPDPAPSTEAAIPPEPDPVPDPTPDPKPEPDLRQQSVQRLLADMTPEEKVGQLFFARCPAAGQTEKVRRYHLGGYLLFGRDFKDAAGDWLTEEQFMETVRSYQEAGAIPLLIGVDEEGGAVARASRDPNLFDQKCKSPQALFAQGGMEAIEADALSKNTRLLELGVNVNLAPVADVSTDPGDFIYDRSFGQDAKATAEYVRTVVAAAGAVSVSGGDAKYHIGSVLKHFPGYGSNADTHTGAALDGRPWEQFIAQDFLPFQAGIDAGAGAVLVSHNVVSCMDAVLPASLSPEIHRILREDLDFRGVILTDDLAMDAVEAYARDGSAAVLAVLAGNDMILTTDFETQIPQVLSALEDGTISQELIDQAVSRVLSWKYDLGLLEENHD